MRSWRTLSLRLSAPMVAEMVFLPYGVLTVGKSNSWASSGALRCIHDTAHSGAFTRAFSSLVMSCRMPAVWLAFGVVALFSCLADCDEVDAMLEAPKDLWCVAPLLLVCQDCGDWSGVGSPCENGLSLGGVARCPAAMPGATVLKRISSV